MRTLTLLFVALALAACGLSPAAPRPSTVPPSRFLAVMPDTFALRVGESVQLVLYEVADSLAAHGLSRGYHWEALDPSIATVHTDTDRIGQRTYPGIVEANAVGIARMKAMLDADTTYYAVGIVFVGR